MLDMLDRSLSTLVGGNSAVRATVSKIAPIYLIHCVGSTSLDGLYTTPRELSKSRKRFRELNVVALVVSAMRKSSTYTTLAMPLERAISAMADENRHQTKADEASPKGSLQSTYIAPSNSYANKPNN